MKGLKCKQKHKGNTKLKILRFSNNKYINNNTKRIGFPLLNKNNDLFLAIKDNDDKLLKFVKNNLVDMDNKELVMKIYNKNIPEIIVDYNKKQNGELSFNINFNKTLSEERKKMEKKTTPYSSNIMVIYIDSVSRAYSIRKLKKTLQFSSILCHLKVVQILNIYMKIIIAFNFLIIILFHLILDIIIYKYFMVIISKV